MSFRTPGVGVRNPYQLRAVFLQLFQAHKGLLSPAHADSTREHALTGSE